MKFHACFEMSAEYRAGDHYEIFVWIYFGLDISSDSVAFCTVNSVVT